MNLLLIEQDELVEEDCDVLLYRMPKINSLWRGIQFKRVGATHAHIVHTNVHKWRRFETEAL